MSGRNGDKARFGRERKKRNLQLRELRKVLVLENKIIETISIEPSKEKTVELTAWVSRADRLVLNAPCQSQGIKSPKEDPNDHHS